MEQFSYFTGEVYRIEDQKNHSTSYSTRTIILKTDEKYIDYVPFTFANKLISQLDKLNVGDVVTIKYRLAGSLYEDKCFANIKGIYAVVLENSEKTRESEEFPIFVHPEKPTESNVKENDLPF